MGTIVWEERSNRMETVRLPRKVEEECDAGRLANELVARAQPLWAGGELRVARAELAPGLEAALRSAYSAGRIVRGLEGAERALGVEKRGQKRVDHKTGVDRGQRVSRLLLLANDGSDRFHRRVESLLLRHAPRVLALRVSAAEDTLGRLLVGRDQVARLLLVKHKDAVSAVLLALAAQWSEKDVSGHRAEEIAGNA